MRSSYQQRRGGGCGDRIVNTLVSFVVMGICYLVVMGGISVAKYIFPDQPTPDIYNPTVAPRQLSKPVPTVIPTTALFFTPLPVSYRPITWNELTNFLVKDHTNWEDYNPNYYVCLDFSIDLVENATKQNIKAWIVGVSFTDNEPGHAIVAFETSDYGVVYIDPQGDNPYWGLEVGKPMCDSWGKYACMGTVLRIEYLRCDRSHNCITYTP